MTPVIRRALVSSLAVVACTPALDWREVQHPAAGIVAVFPCRPRDHIRSVMLGKAATSVHLMACSAGDQTFGISYVDVAAVDAIEPVLSALQMAATSHVQASHVSSVPLNVAGATPLASSTLVSIDGRTKDGSSIHLKVGVFASRLRVYQATTFAPAADRDASESFFSGIKVR